MTRTAETRARAKVTPTHGILFDDGSAIDRLRDSSLVICHRGKILLAKTIDYMERRYESAYLDPSLESLIHFPTGADEFGTAEELLADLETELGPCVGLDANNTCLLAFSILSTYFPECLPTIPIINVYAALGAEVRALDVLSCLCRRPLLLADISAREAFRLPSDLSPTLMFRSANPQKLQPLLACISNAGAILRDGEASSLRWPMVIATTEPLHHPALRIPLLPSMPYGRLPASELEALAGAFQGKFLMFRLQRHREVSASRFDVPSFAPETRLLAAALGAVMEGFPSAQARLIDALKTMDEGEKVGRAQLPATAVVEVLLAACHAKEAAILNAEVTNATNCLLLARGERLQLSTKEVGGIVGRLGLIQKRQSPGFELRLEQSVIARIHQLAENLGTLSLLKPFTGCASCADLLSIRQPPAEVHDIHEVHEFTSKEVKK